MMTRRLVRPVFATVVCALMASVAMATPSPRASARYHTYLKKSEPAARDTVSTSPTALRLWFSEQIALPVSRVQLLTATGTELPLGPLTRATNEGAPVVAAVTKPLDAGTYTVKWKVASKDGHPVSGTFAFVVRGGR